MVEVYHPQFEEQISEKVEEVFRLIQENVQIGLLKEMTQQELQLKCCGGSEVKPGAGGEMGVIESREQPSKPKAADLVSEFI